MRPTAARVVSAGVPCGMVSSTTALSASTSGKNSNFIRPEKMYPATIMNTATAMATVVYRHSIAPFDQGPVGAFDRPLHPLAEEALKTVPTTRDAVPLPVFAPVRQVGQVIRQHQHGLDQRERQTADDDQGNRPRDGARGAFHRVDQRREGGHGGEDRERDRRRHLARAVDRRTHAPLAHLEVAVDVLAHHDRVVDPRSRAPG